MLKKILGTMLLLGLPCAIGCICLSEEIVLIMAGEEYLASAQSLKILMISFIFKLLGDVYIFQVYLKNTIIITPIIAKIGAIKPISNAINCPVIVVPILAPIITPID